MSTNGAITHSRKRWHCWKCPCGVTGRCVTSASRSRIVKTHSKKCAQAEDGWAIKRWRELKETDATRGNYSWNDSHVNEDATKTVTRIMSQPQAITQTRPCTDCSSCVSYGPEPQRFNRIECKQCGHMTCPKWANVKQQAIKQPPIQLTVNQHEY